MLRYKIYTERKNMRWLTTMISEYFGGFTVLKALGYWQGKPEKSVCIEIITDDPLAEYRLHQIRLKIEGYNVQDEVLITKSEVEKI